MLKVVILFLALYLKLQIFDLQIMSEIVLYSTLGVLALGITLFFSLRKPKPDNQSVKETTPEKTSKKSKGQNKTQNNEEQPQKTENNSQPTAGTGGQKKKKKKGEAASTGSVGCKTAKQLQQTYGDTYYGSVSIRNPKALCNITALTVKHSKVLFGNSRNELVMYDLKKWKAHTPSPDLYYTSLDNNTATALAISPNYYFAALSFDKTIAYYEFKGGEGGVYFREVRKFARNLYRGAQGALAVGEGERFVVGTGIEADTTINVWSMQGEKLANVSTYQIEHYEVRFGGPLIVVRGWTSQIKTFRLVTDKEGGFSKLDKAAHLTHNEKPTAAVIDNLGLHALTITADAEQVKLWHLAPLSPQQQTVESYAIGVVSPKFAAVITLRGDNQRLRTVVVVANGSKMVVLSRSLSVIQEVEGIAVQGLQSFGASKSAVAWTLSNGRLSVWDFTKLALQQPEYVV